MNVGKIQRLSETHENLEKFLKVCLISGIELSIRSQGHTAVLNGITTGLLLSYLRKGIRTELATLEAHIREEVQGGD